MKQDIDLIKLVESIGCEVVANKLPNIKFRALDPKGNQIGDLFNTWRDVVSGLGYGTEIEAEIKKEYWAEIDWTHSERAYCEYVDENFKRIAEDMGYTFEPKKVEE